MVPFFAGVHCWTVESHVRLWWLLWQVSGFVTQRVASSLFLVAVSIVYSFDTVLLLFDAFGFWSSIVGFLTLDHHYLMLMLYFSLLCLWTSPNGSKLRAPEIGCGKYQSWTESKASRVPWAVRFWHFDLFPFGCSLRCYCSPTWDGSLGHFCWEVEASGCSMGAFSLWLAATCLFHGMVQLLSLPLLPSIWEYLVCGDFVERTWQKNYLASDVHGRPGLRSTKLKGHGMQSIVFSMTPVVCYGKRPVFGPLQSSTLQTMTFCWQVLTATGMCRYGRELSLIGCCFECAYAAYPLLKIQVLLEFAYGIWHETNWKKHECTWNDEGFIHSLRVSLSRWYKVVPQLAKLVDNSSD